MTDLFVYGTLVFPEILEAVVGRTFARVAATVRDHERVRVRDGSYPALRAAQGAATRGFLCRDVDADSLDVLDRFEGDLYDRVVLEVEPDGAPACDAFTYVVPADRGHQLTDEPWDPDTFGVRGRDAFLASVRRGEAP